MILLAVVEFGCCYISSLPPPHFPVCISLSRTMFFLVVASSLKTTYFKKPVRDMSTDWTPGKILKVSGLSGIFAGGAVATAPAPPPPPFAHNLTGVVMAVVVVFDQDGCLRCRSSPAGCVWIDSLCRT